MPETIPPFLEALYYFLASVNLMCNLVPWRSILLLMAVAFKIRESNSFAVATLPTSVKAVTTEASNCWFCDLLPMLLASQMIIQSPPWNTTRPLMCHFSLQLFWCYTFKMYIYIYTDIYIYIYIYIILMPLDRSKPKKKNPLWPTVAAAKTPPSRPACRPWRVWTSWEQV